MSGPMAPIASRPSLGRRSSEVVVCVEDLGKRQDRAAVRPFSKALGSGFAIPAVPAATT